MKIKNCLAGLFCLVAIGVLGYGCTAEQLSSVQKDSQAAGYVLGATTQPTTQPATQPSSSLAVAHSIVAGVEVAYPVTVPLFGLLGGLALMVGGVAGKLLGEKQTQASANQQIATANAQATSATQQATVAGSAITEIIEDVAAFKNPAEPWTDATYKLLMDLGETAAAVITK